MVRSIEAGLYSAAEFEEDTMNETQSLMRRHSSVRRFENRAIDRKLLENLIACGQAASSASFIQAYSLVRVSEPGKRKRIAEAAGGQRWVVEAPEFLVICADLKRIDYCCEKAGEGRLEGWTEHFMAATIDAALMAQNLLLAAEAEGLGGVFVGGIRNHPREVADCLNLPSLVYPAFGLCLGWPAERNEVKPRFPVATVLHEETYDAEAIPRQVDDYDAVMREYYASRSHARKQSDWSQQTARAVQGKKREHMLDFLRHRGFLKR
jgi:nitroreductase